MKTTGIIRKAIDYCKGLSGEAVRYIIIGALTTLVDLAIFTLMAEILLINVHVSNVTSTSIAILFAYVTNKLIVFKNRCETRGELALEFIRFVGARLVTMAMNMGCVFLFVDVIGQRAFVGKAESLVLVVISNYIISKTLVFRRKQGDT